MRYAHLRHMDLGLLAALQALIEERSITRAAPWAHSAPREFRTQVLFRDCFMCLVRRRHPLGTAPLTLERYLAYPHALVALAHQRQGVLDKMLEDKGIERRVQLRIPYFASAAWAIEQSDMILTGPKRLACRLQKISQTTMLEPPIEP